VTTHLVFFIRTLYGGGAERVFLKLAGALATAGYTVTIVAVNAPAEERDWLPANVEVVDLAARSLAAAIPKLARLLRARRPAAVLSAVSAANVVALVASALAGGRTPVIVTEHNTQSVQRADAQKFMRRTGTPWLMRRLYPRAAAIVGVSEGVSADLEQFLRLPADSVKSIPNPVVDRDLDLAAGQPIPAAWADQLAGSPLVVSAGRLVPHKDHAMLLRAFARVHDQMPEARLAILGEGESADSISAQIVELGLEDAVVAPGFQSNPYAWFARADVLALSSRYEGLPTILIEALACGARVVSTDCPSGPSQILDGGRLGTLTPVGDDEAFARALMGALRMGRWPQPPREALADYRPEAVAAAYQRVVDAVVARR